MKTERAQLFRLLPRAAELPQRRQRFLTMLDRPALVPFFGPSRSVPFFRSDLYFANLHFLAINKNVPFFVSCPLVPFGMGRNWSAKEVG